MSLVLTRAFLDAVKSERDAERVAASFAQHLAPLTVGTLPASAQPNWREVARLLKGPAEKPIPDTSVAAIKSWPAARIGELVALVAKLNETLERVENDRLEDEIRDSIRRHYL